MLLWIIQARFGLGHLLSRLSLEKQAGIPAVQLILSLCLAHTENCGATPLFCVLCCHCRQTVKSKGAVPLKQRQQPGAAIYFLLAVRRKWKRDKMSRFENACSRRHYTQNSFSVLGHSAIGFVWQWNKETVALTVFYSITAFCVAVPFFMLNPVHKWGFFRLFLLYLPTKSI